MKNEQMYLCFSYVSFYNVQCTSVLIGTVFKSHYVSVMVSLTHTLAKSAAAAHFDRQKLWVQHCEIVISGFVNLYEKKNWTNKTKEAKEINCYSTNHILHVFIYTCKRLSGYVRATVINIT